MLRMPVLQENQRFERYRIIQQVGSGVSGESYEAEDTMLQRKVTLKLIHPWAPLTESARRQFFREMQTISLLHHPYLASVFDYGEIDGQLYVVRRYVSSGSLLSNDGRLWFRPPFRIPDALHYGHQLAQALDYIHNHGCLHGGLTLANILILRGPTIDREPDFAPFLLADVGLTNFVRRFGQPQIRLLPITAAPEQLGQRVTPASDQFALAVLLYLWLAGLPPYLGSPEEIEHMKLTETIAPLSSLNSNVTPEQETILHHALNVYPEERYPSILAFADALLATLAPPVHTTPLPRLTSQSEVVPAFDEIPHTDPLEVNLEHQPQPEPLPQPAPEPLPAPAPEPLPQPAPDPLPAPDPEPLPQPAPETLPQPDPRPAPDIYQPLPQPATEPEPTPLPETETPAESLSSEHEEPIAQPTISPRIIISYPDIEEPDEFMLKKNEITLGRASSDDVLLNHDTSTSRHHALLKYEDGHYVIYDQRSTNGVFVNGQKLEHDVGYRLEDGDHISIGNYELIFRFNIKQYASSIA